MIRRYFSLVRMGFRFIYIYIYIYTYMYIIWDFEIGFDTICGQKLCTFTERKRKKGKYIIRRSLLFTSALKDKSSKILAVRTKKLLGNNRLFSSSFYIGFTYFRISSEFVVCMFYLIRNDISGIHMSACFVETQNIISLSFKF